MGKNHVEDCKQLLGYMGIPYVEAPCEVSEGYLLFTLLLYSHCFLVRFLNGVGTSINKMGNTHVTHSMNSN